MHTLINELKNIRFGENELKYLKSFNILDKQFLNFLREFKLNVKISSIEEGRIVFPKHQ